jgi:hypothetical protein
VQQYLLSIYQPDGPVPDSDTLRKVMADLAALNAELDAAGALIFTGGLHPAGTATVLRAKDDDVLLTDGPFIEGKEHLGGLYVIRAADLDAALHWARRVARLLAPLAIEVRPFAG